MARNLAAAAVPDATRPKAALVKTLLRRMQYRPGLIEGFLAGTRLDFTPFCNPQMKIVSAAGPLAHAG